MPLSWNEIKSRATAFSNEWKDEVSEDAEAKSFWNDFFKAFSKQPISLTACNPLSTEQNALNFYLSCTINTLRGCF